MPPDFKAKLHKILSPPQTPLGELTALHRLLAAVFKDSTSKWRDEEEVGRKERGGQKEKGKEEKGREGREGKGPAPKYFGLEWPILYK